VQPETIYNLDEDGFLLGQALKEMVILCRGRKILRYTQNGDPTMVLVIKCIAADGQGIPPMYIYQGGQHLLGWHAGVQDKQQATFGWSTKG
jgi:hypothetical protein